MIRHLGVGRSDTYLSDDPTPVPRSFLILILILSSRYRLDVRIGSVMGSRTQELAPIYAVRRIGDGRWVMSAPAPDLLPPAIHQDRDRTSRALGGTFAAPAPLELRHARALTRRSARTGGREFEAIS